MTLQHQHEQGTARHSGLRNWLCSRTGIAAFAAVAVLGFLVYTGHSTDLLGLAPYLLILSCPLMHIFMHGGHHHRHRRDSKREDA